MEMFLEVVFVVDEVVGVFVVRVVGLPVHLEGVRVLNVVRVVRVAGLVRVVACLLVAVLGMHRVRNLVRLVPGCLPLL